MKSGTFPTTKLKDRIEVLLAELEAAAKEDKAAGRLVWADTQMELIELVTEYMRLHENVKQELWGS